jgi:hypothetical protein
MLASHELVRIKFPAAKKKAQAKEWAEQISVLVGAEVAQVLGHTALLYRKSPAQLIDFSTGPAGDATGEISDESNATGILSDESDATGEMSDESGSGSV